MENGKKWNYNPQTAKIFRQLKELKIPDKSLRGIIRNCDSSKTTKLGNRPIIEYSADRIMAHNAGKETIYKSPGTPYETIEGREALDIIGQDLRRNLSVEDPFMDIISPYIFG